MITDSNLVILCDELQLMDTEQYSKAVLDTASTLPAVNKMVGSHDDIFELFDVIERRGFAMGNPRVSTFKREFTHVFLRDVRKVIERDM